MDRLRPFMEIDKIGLGVSANGGSIVSIGWLRMENPSINGWSRGTAFQETSICLDCDILRYYWQGKTRHYSFRYNNIKLDEIRWNWCWQMHAFNVNHWQAYSKSKLPCCKLHSPTQLGSATDDMAQQSMQCPEAGCRPEDCSNLDRFEVWASGLLKLKNKIKLCFLLLKVWMVHTYPHS